MTTVLQRTYELPSANKRETLRYAGVRGEAKEIEAILDDCLKETAGCFSAKLCWCRMSVDEARDVPALKTAFLSKALLRHIEDCREIVIFAATVGIDIDRAVARYEAISPTKALLASAIGSERIEALCDEFEKSLKEEGNEIRPRFSPGYSDLPIECQRAIFSLLECSRRIGLTLNESMMMSPSKSVSAIIGIK